MEQTTLFTAADEKNQPLAARLRPHTLDDFVGQRQLLGEGKILQHMITHDELISMIFWGRPAWAKPPWRKSSPTRPARASSPSAPS
nr:hypothetical protein [uncultured Cardiobacterium sp.]